MGLFFLGIGKFGTNRLCSEKQMKKEKKKKTKDKRHNKK